MILIFGQLVFLSSTPSDFLTPCCYWSYLRTPTRRWLDPLRSHDLSIVCTVKLRGVKQILFCLCEKWCTNYFFKWHHIHIVQSVKKLPKNPKGKCFFIFIIISNIARLILATNVRSEVTLLLLLAFSCVSFSYSKEFCQICNKIDDKVGSHVGVVWFVVIFVSNKFWWLSL